YLCKCTSLTYPSAYFARLFFSSWPLKDLIIKTFGLIDPSNAQLMKSAVAQFRKEKGVQVMVENLADVFKRFQSKKTKPKLKLDYIYAEKDIIADAKQTEEFKDILNI